MKRSLFLSLALVCSWGQAQVTGPALPLSRLAPQLPGTIVGAQNAGSPQALNVLPVASNIPAAYLSINRASTAIVSGGTGYAVGDTITLACSVCTVTTSPIAVVSVVSSGVITGMQINQPGIFSAVTSPVATLTQSATSGSGSGASFSVSFGPLAASISVAALTTGGAANDGSLYINAGDALPSAFYSTYGAENVCIGDKTCGAMSGNSAYNTAVGHQAYGFGAGCTLSNSLGNTAMGNDSMRNPCGNISFYTAYGYWAGRNPSAGGNNTAIGAYALQGSTTAPTGQGNTAVGYYALGGTGITTASSNTAVGWNALGSNSLTTSQQNAAVGTNAMANTTTGSFNAAFGFQALAANTTGFNEVGVGENALGASLNCAGSTAVGYYAGNTCTNDITAVGQYTLGNVSAAGNVAVGGKSFTAAISGINNTGLGYQNGTTLTTGAGNVIIGQAVASTTLTTGSNNILVGPTNAVDTVAASTSNEINLNNTLMGYASLTGIGVTSGGGTGYAFSGSGTMLFILTEGSTGTPSTTLVLAMPQAPNDWGCDALDRSSTTITARQTGGASATAVTFSFSSAPANNDVIQIKCLMR